LDIFAESIDHRVIIEIQRIDYDYNFDRFLHYFIMAIAQLQRSSEQYKIRQTVFTIVVLTEPYKFDQRSGLPIRDEGRKEGLEEGKRVNAIETARKMKTDGLAVDLISKYTGLTPADIEGL
jgi:hypothetical protein